MIFLYFFLNSVYNVAPNGLGSSCQEMCGCFLFIKSRMGKIPDSLYTKMELVSFGGPKMLLSGTLCFLSNDCKSDLQASRRTQRIIVQTVSRTCTEL